MFTASEDDLLVDSCAVDDWGPPPDEGDHFDWAEFQKLIARDTHQACPAMVPDPDSCPSGPMAAHLDSGTLNPDVLADSEMIDAIIGFDHLISWAGARQARLLSAFARRRPADSPEGSQSRWAADEIALALSQSRITATAKLGQATQLNETLGATLTAWEAGELDALKVRAICDATLRLDEPQARAVQDRVLPRAATQTLSQLTAALKRAVLAVDPDGGNERHTRARNERRVVLTPVDDGMATLWACLTAPDAQTCYGWLTALARGLGKDDPRGMDARRVDLMRDLLTGQLTIIPTDPAGGDTVTAPGPGTTNLAATNLVGTNGSGTNGSGTAAADTETTTAPTSTDQTGSDPAATTAEHTTQTAWTGTGTGPGPAGPTTSDPTTSDSDNVNSDSVSGRETGNRETSGHDTGCAGCACPTRPPPPPPLPPWRPAPVAPGKPLVQIVVPLTTLTGTDDQPVELVGYGPIPTDLARTISADAVWKRLITDPLSGTLLDHGRNTYRPPAALADFVRARDQVCRFPPCNRRAIDIELDHTIPWTNNNGPTADHNLYGACPHHHHHLKHDAPGWTVTQTPDGSVTWTTPTGHSYTSTPYDYRPEPTPPIMAAKTAREPTPVRPDLPDPWTLPAGTDDAPF